MSDILELQDLPRGHLSFTQIGMYLRCPYQYFLRYKEKIKCPIKPALVFGISLHTAEEHNFRERIITGKFPSIPEVHEQFVVKAEALPNELEVDWKDRHGNASDSLDKIKDDGGELIKIYDAHARAVQEPLAVEEEFEHEFENVDYTLVGRRDLRTADEVTDFKTSAKSFNQEAINHDTQLTAYQIGLDSIKQLAIHGFIRTKSPKIQIIEMPARNTEQIAGFLHNMNMVAQLIRTGIFPKRDINNWPNCSWCGYRQYGYCK